MKETYTLIWKYPMPLREAFVLEMPKGARILKFAVQRKRPCLWVLVDALAQTEKRSFFTTGTGIHIDKPAQYIDTILLDDDNLVVHLFETT
jgi:hypothetical protein